MSALPEITSSGTALLAGLVTSLHCAGMCGPLACVIMPTKPGEGDVMTISTVYHGGRILSYSLLGALAGGVGEFTAGFLENSVIRWLPWLMVLFFIGMAFKLEQYLPKLMALSRWSMRLHAWLRSRSRVQAGFALGVATPLLPCGPLYFAVAAALLAGSSIKGLEFMFTFALGTVPVLWLAQSQFHWLRSKLAPLWMARIRISMALMAALWVGWRLRGTLGFEGPGLENFICCF